MGQHMGQQMGRRGLASAWARIGMAPSSALRPAFVFALVVGALALAGCGATAGSMNAPAPSAQHSTAGSGVVGAPASGSAGSSTGAGTSTGSSSGGTQSPPSPQYLIKSLSVSLSLPDTPATANELQRWISATDPKSQSAGITYARDGDQYDISMTFSVEASVYPQVEAYLAGYASAHKGTLVSLQESVQDVTGDYVDSQSRLSNLRREQTRLQTLMGQASSLSDVLTIEQRLTDVEGQIEQIEARLNHIAGETTFYTVQIQLIPITAGKVIVAPPWDPGQVFHSAFESAKAFGEGLVSLLIWLGVFAIYIVPALLIIWFVIWFVRRTLHRRMARPALAAAPLAAPPAP